MLRLRRLVCDGRHPRPIGAKRRAKATFTLRTGKSVKALDGVVITRARGKVRVLRNVTLGTERRVTVEAGDILYTLRPTGEGHELLWYGGRTYSDQLWDAATFEVLETPEWVWWVKVRAGGRSGWVLGADDFKGADACSGPV